MDQSERRNIIMEENEEERVYHAESMISRIWRRTVTEKKRRKTSLNETHYIIIIIYGNEFDSFSSL